MSERARVVDSGQCLLGEHALFILRVPIVAAAVGSRAAAPVELAEINLLNILYNLFGHPVHINLVSGSHQVCSSSIFQVF